MEAVKLIFIVTCYSFLSGILAAKLSSIRFTTISDCNKKVSNQVKFFNSVSLQCESCAKGTKVTDDGLSCECKQNFRFVKANADGLPECEECKSGQVVSQDKTRCIHCSINHSYNQETQKCLPCSLNEIVVDQELNGNLNNVSRCLPCNNAYSVADPDQNRCISCSASYLSVGKGSCICPSSKYEVIGTECVNKSLNLLPKRDSVYAIKYGKETIISEFIKENARKMSYYCSQLKQKLACQHLANMCVLQLYKYEQNKDSICNRISKWNNNGPYPWILYSREDIGNILTASTITTHYKFTANSEDSRLNLFAAIFSINGTLIELTEVNGGMLQLCDYSFSALDKTYDFGTEYVQECFIKAKKFWEEGRTKFIELYVKYDESGPKLYPVPVLIKNMKSGELYNNEGGKSEWQLVKRFALVDNVGGIDTVNSEKPAKYVRYVRSFNIKINFQTRGEGKIEPPLVSLDYEVANRENHYDKDAEVKVSFSINYYRSKWREEEDISIALGVFGAVAATWAAFKTWKWSRRAGKDAIDFVTLIKLLVFTCGNLANLFFIIFFFSSFFQFVIFKSQDEAFLTLPTYHQEYDFRVYLYLIFAMKFIQVVDIIYSQVTTNIFLLDWERPREIITKSNGNANERGEIKNVAPVSIWRTYFIANEWNELQINRRISLTVQLLTVLFFLKIVGFEELARIEPKSTFTSHDWSQFVPYSQTARFSILTIIYFIVAILLYSFRKFIYERFIEDPLQQFVDICCLSNISIFILLNGRFGYYIHGRAGVGHADTDMREMYEQLKREEDDLCSHRGLLPNADAQTFQVIVPQEIRNQYNRLMIPATSRTVQANRMQQTGRGNNQFISPDVDRILTSYMSMNKFLAGFIDHAIRDIDYQVKEKLFLEDLFEVESYDITNKGIFYQDNKNLFSNTLLLGCEWSLVLLELLTFCVTDVISHDFLLGAVITYIISQAIVYFRKSWGRRNVAQKTLIDQRFLI